MMRPRIHHLAIGLIVLLLVFLAPQIPMAEAQQVPAKDAQKDSEVIRMETSLVTVPVVASDRGGRYIADLRQAEFSLFEDGVRQEIVFFSTANEPFHVVLMLDTSGSTREKLSSIQRAARAFVTTILAVDRVKVMSFDERIRDLCEFSNDRTTLENAIAQTQPGEGTKLYDAFHAALAQLKTVKGRKAIVIFTDGVDYRSDTQTYDSSLAELEESGVIAYPIRFDTRADTEAMIRRQEDQYGSATDVGLILGGPPMGTTPPIVRGDGGTSSPQQRPTPREDPYKLPIPSIILGPTGRMPDPRNPDEGRYPDDRSRGRTPMPDGRYPPVGRSEDRVPDANDPRVRRGRVDSTSILLDGLYSTADRYLEAMAQSSGARLHRADTLAMLPTAFANIAAELRQQYSLGYYSTNPSNDRKFRKIQIKLSRKDAVVRAKPGYRRA